MPLRCLIDLDARTVLTCEKKLTGRAVLDNNWKFLRKVDFLDAGDSWHLGAPVYYIGTHPKRYGGRCGVLKLSVRDLYTVTAALAQVHLMREGKLPSWRCFQRYFYGAFPAVKTMTGLAIGAKLDPEQTAFMRRAYDSAPDEWDRIKVAAARHRTGEASMNKPPRLEHIDPRACRALWRAVLSTMLIDLQGKPGQERDAAEIWFDRGPDMPMVAVLAGLDGHLIRERHRAGKLGLMDTYARSGSRPARPLKRDAA